MQELKPLETVVHVPSGQTGVILKTLPDWAERANFWGLFQSTTGAIFSVRATECEPEGYELDPLERLFLQEDYRPMQRQDGRVIL